MRLVLFVVDWIGLDWIGYHAGVWKELASLSQTRYGLFLYGSGDYIYALGGNTGSTEVERLQVFSIPFGVIPQWTVFSAMEMPRTRMHSFGAVANGQLHLCGSGICDVWDEKQATWNPQDSYNTALFEYDGPIVTIFSQTACC